MTTPNRTAALAILTDRGIITREKDTFRVNSDIDKYPAVIELAITLKITTNHARTLVNGIIARTLADPLTDPAQDRRGGRRKGAGRKYTKKIDT